MSTKIFILSLFISGSFFAQNFSGTATYKTHRKSPLMKLDSTSMPGNLGMQEKLQEQLNAQMRKMFQKTFTLDFTRTESMYREEQVLDAPRVPQQNGVTITFEGLSGSTEEFYKNINEKRITNKKELMGKTFLIKDAFIAYDWKLTGETKNIGIYTCYKAVFEKEEEAVELKIVDGEAKEEKGTKKIRVIAWYTPDVPISNGPGNYGGLPGLILEVNDDGLTIVCTEIALNPSKTIEIKEPTKGKQVTRKKFSEISLEKSKEMMNRYRSRDGKGIEIIIGG